MRHHDVKTRSRIATEIAKFLAPVPNLELWSWNAAHHHVLLSQLYGTARDVPEIIPDWTNDLHQEAHRLDVHQRDLPAWSTARRHALDDAHHHLVLARCLDAAAVADLPTLLPRPAAGLVTTMTTSHTTMIGRLIKDPELYRPKNGGVKTTFTIEERPAIAERGRERGTSRQAVLMRCVAWRGLAHQIAEAFTVGSRVIVVGTLVQRVRPVAGVPSRVLELEVSAIGALLHEGADFLTATAAPDRELGE